MMITTSPSGFRTREHPGFGHGLQPGTDSDINCPSCTREDAARRDATADFTAHVNRSVPAGHCTGCEATGKLFRYGREILCGTCMDTQLDLMAKAVSEVIDLVPQADGSWAVA